MEAIAVETGREAAVDGSNRCGDWERGSREWKLAGNEAGRQKRREEAGIRMLLTPYTLGFYKIFKLG